MLVIKSSSGRGLLKIEPGGHGWWSVRLEVESLRAEGRVDDAGSRYGVPLQRFLGDLAAHWRGWDNSKEWESIEGGLRLEARHDGLGHIALTATLRDLAERNAWRAVGRLTLDAGGLDALARAAQRFEDTAPDH